MSTEAEQQLLHHARNGNAEEVRQLLETMERNEVTADINCKGRSKSNLGWTPLHLACYFGHRQVVQDLLKAGAEVNVLNDMGDTPLHRAAFTGRKELVMLLLEYNAHTTVVNGNGQTAKEVTHDKEIRNMLEAVERTQQRKLEELLLAAAREGRTAELTALLNRPNPPAVNCSDQLGNTPLHCAAYRAHKQCALKLLKSGADPNLKNKNDQKPLDLAQGAEMKHVLVGNKVIYKALKRYEGPLWKSSRFFGWRLFWVVLEHGVLSWYRKQPDAVHNIYRQGCKHLTQAVCTVKPTDSCLFFIKCFDDTVHGFRVPKNSLQQTREDWLEAIEEHSAYSTHYCSQDQLTDDEEEDAVSGVDLKESLEKAQICQQRLDREISNFLRMIKECDVAKEMLPSFLQKVEVVSEASRETCVALSDCLNLFTKQEGPPSLEITGLQHSLVNWLDVAVPQSAFRCDDDNLGIFLQVVRNFKLEQEQEKNKILSEALATLATEHHELEQSLVKGSPPLSILSEDEFYDALSDSESERSLSRLEAVTAHCFEEEGEHLRSRKHRMSEGKDCGGGDALSNGIKKHRTSLPSPMFSRNDFSIWSILRKCIGMELSKITMPVIFNEPLSFLQRLTEYMEHTYLIHKASSFADPVERMQCVAAFAVSAVASQWERTGKPFNPLLGETYELVRDDLGFRLISEQVSHHPPISAFHAEGLNNDFIFHGSIYPKLKFWGKSVEAEPKGTITLELLEHNEAYTWTNPTCCVHNIIVGKLWIEQYGNVEITNHKTADKCVLNFKPCGLFGKELHKVEGYIQDKSKKKLCALYGKWTECLYSVDPATFDAYKKNDKKNTEEKKNSKQMSASEESDEMPMPDSESVFVIPGSVLLWRIAPRPPNSTQMYNFTSFAMVLNEVDKEMESVIPKTDCRLRPDIRAMENGEIDQASEEKKRLEEKQRAARKNRSKLEEDWKTRWFHQGPNPYSGAQDWLYSGSYWDRNYFNLPDIY
ncbi:oxysterol-binding protein-related protein 1 isoform X1 [Neophocaena asiaeorientalis asiaeorientalis]|uniref:Oxysterol-binding protein n=3 Tax=Odontoceti TaxID=9722 RepID=A0A341CFU7_NEOAA|nr:oxysterol-binding protein-related protein 1 isoform X1 [Neophocaena asiaeorientalis asiaeorientalis]XP_024613636.1 oxysterol-binding protein-related protein 1 isoform X1 [Neophocaena asiaeorientalis asiaeorientalis]XP_024613637.1 oxysterol-binding protein-related protein 1 isoform X1 [Neophocaena asiaeorientalis asiaeorientalis]